MATITVTIKYVGAPVEEVRAGMPITSMFTRTGSYVDSPAFTEGYKNSVNAAADEKIGEVYGKSVYATNVPGWGSRPGLLPMAHTPTRMAQFERAIAVAAKAAEEGTENTGITFEIVDDYKEEIYWNQMAPSFVDQGFYIAVGDTTYGTDTSVEAGTTEDPSEEVTEESTQA